MEFRLEQKGNYAGRYKSQPAGAEIGYYTNKQMQALYPTTKIDVVGEVGFQGKNPTGSAGFAGEELPVYPVGSHNRLTSSVCGYTAVQGGGYLSVIRNVLLRRLVSLLIVLAVIGGTAFVAANWDSWFADQPVGGLTVDPNAGDWSSSSLPNQAGEGEGIAIPGYPSISIAANQKDVRITLLNPEGNPCYFTFELVLEDTGETLYASQAVPPGQAVSEISLSRGLPAGEYPATIRIQTHSLVDQTPMNGANVETVLIAG